MLQIKDKNMLFIILWTYRLKLEELSIKDSNQGNVIRLNIATCTKHQFLVRIYPY